MSDIEKREAVYGQTGISGIANQPELSDEDVYAAMKDIEGYLDISMRDFRELYSHARITSYNVCYTKLLRRSLG